jgi:ATP-dependent DNA helicase PIF1
VHKYIYKGLDRAILESGEDIDEIKQYMEGRYISSHEACWRILGFETNGISHNIIRLPVHLPNQQYVRFHAARPIETALQNNEKTMLTDFFKVNLDIQQSIQNGVAPLNLFTYCEFLEHYAWNQRTKTWVRRQRAWKVVALMTVAPPATEQFYLRMLLNHVRGTKSFNDLNTHNGTEYPTSKEAALSKGLLHNDAEYEACMQEATPADVEGLFHRHFDAMAEDQRDVTERQKRINIIQILNSHLQPFSVQISHLLDLTAFIGGALGDNNMSLPNNDDTIHDNNYDVEDIVQSLNDNQRQIFDQICATVRNSDNIQETTFFIDGPGGTGKTYLYNTVLKYLRNVGFNWMAMASSGIAACLLDEGKTAHSTLAIPLEINEVSACNFGARSKIAHALQNTHLIIWDDAPMASRFAIEAVDKTMQDVLGNNEPFEGKVVIFGGDFRQILRVVLVGYRSQTVWKCLKMSPLWNRITSLQFNLQQICDYSQIQVFKTCYKVLVKVPLETMLRYQIVWWLQEKV